MLSPDSPHITSVCTILEAMDVERGADILLKFASKHDEVSIPVPDYAAAVRSHELFQNSQDEVCVDIAGSVKVLKLEGGQCLPRSLDYWPLMVLEGNVHASVEARSHSTSDTPLEHGTMHSKVLKSIRDGEALTPMISTLAWLCALGRTEAARGTNMTCCSPGCGTISSLELDPTMTLRAASNTRLAIIPLTDLHHALLTRPNAFLDVLYVAVRRVYTVTFPMSGAYFGLHEEVLECERDLCRQKLREIGSVKSSLFTDTGLEQLCLEASKAYRNDGGRGVVLYLPDKSKGRQSAARSDPTTVARQPLPRERARLSVLEASDVSFGSNKMPLQVKDICLRVQVPQTIYPRNSEMSSQSNFGSPSVLSCTEKHTLRAGEADFDVDTNHTDQDYVSPDLRISVLQQILQQLGEGSLHDFDRNANYYDDQADQIKAKTCLNLTQNLQAADNLEFVYFPKGSALAHAGERYSGLYLILSGSLEATTVFAVPDMIGDDPQLSQDTFSFTVGEGDLVGCSILLTNNKSMFNISAREDTYAAFLPRAALSLLSESNPILLSNFGIRLLETLPRVLKLVDYGIDWRKFDAGQKVYRKDDASDGLYVVLTGRLRTWQRNVREQAEHYNEIGQGQAVGALELYTNRKRSANLSAIRRSDVIRIQVSSYRTLSLTFPSLAFRLSKIIASSAPSLIQQAVSPGGQQLRKSAIRTIAVLPTSGEIPVERFCQALAMAISETRILPEADILMLNARALLKSLGASIFERRGTLRLENYLNQVQDNVKLIIFVGDPAAESTWTKICMTHADTLLFVCMAENDPTLTDLERKAEEIGVVANRKLVILHRQNWVDKPCLTQSWLEERLQYGYSYQHVRLPRPKGLYDHQDTANPLLPDLADFHRLARRTFDRSIALVLGGGGARGIAHLGVLQALEDEGIPIDIIGGTSIGSFIGSLYSRLLSFEATKAEARRWSRGMSTRKYLSDFSFPYCALTTGRTFSDSIKRVFGNLHMTDFWLDTYCSVTNVTRNCTAQTCTKGRAWDLIRGSMSVSGFVPPICTPEGDMLLDGCYSANLPIGHAQSLGAEVIFAIDVSAEFKYEPFSYGATLSGWKTLLERFNPLRTSSKPLPPSFPELSDALMMTTSTHEREMVKKAPGCHYLKMPVEVYSATAFDSFDEIYAVGYETATKWLAKLRADGHLDGLAVPVCRKEADACI